MGEISKHIHRVLTLLQFHQTNPSRASDSVSKYARTITPTSRTSPSNISSKLSEADHLRNKDLSLRTHRWHGRTIAAIVRRGTRRSTFFLASSSSGIMFRPMKMASRKEDFAPTTCCSVSRSKHAQERPSTDSSRIPKDDPRGMFSRIGIRLSDHWETEKARNDVYRMTVHRVLNTRLDNLPPLVFPSL